MSDGRGERDGNLLKEGDMVTLADGSRGRVLRFDDARSRRTFVKTCVDYEELAQDIALSDYWKAHPETPKNAQEKDLVTRTNMRRRVRQALRFGFVAGQWFEREGELGE